MEGFIGSSLASAGRCLLSTWRNARAAELVALRESANDWYADLARESLPSVAIRPLFRDSNPYFTAIAMRPLPCATCGRCT